MHDIVNIEQAAAWNGPEGHHWAAHASHAPTDIDRHILEAADLRRGDRVLDVGCGTGQTSRAAARTTPAGRVLGLDLSGPQLAEARRRAARDGLTNVAFEQGDAQVHPLPAGSIDVAVSRFGIMFFADPVAAFANVARALASGGRLAVVCPQAAADQTWYTAPLAGLLGEDAPVPALDDGPGMFSLANPDRIVAVLDAAGFAEVEATTLTTPMDFGPDVATAVGFYLGSGPVRALLEDQPELAEPARARLEATMTRYLTPTGVQIPASHWLVTAHRP